MSDYSLANIDQFIDQELGLSRWHTIDQAQINAFADATGDHQWIHVDTEKAQASPLGSTIAHGFLTLSLLPMLLDELGIIPSGVSHTLNYGADKVRFTSFVKVDSRVRVRITLMSATPKRGGVLLKTLCEMEIEGEERPAMVAETLSLVFPA